MEQETYNEIYSDFITRYNSGEVFTGEAVGFVIVRLTHSFSEKNLLLGDKENKLRKIALANISKIEENGKPITIGKADILTDASTEAEEYRRVKIDLDNCSQMIYAMRAIQGGMVREYAHSQN